MSIQPAPIDVIQDLDARQDDLLSRLEELDRQIQRVLTDWTAKQPAPPTLDV